MNKVIGILIIIVLPLAGWFFLRNNRSESANTRAVDTDVNDDLQEEELCNEPIRPIPLHVKLDQRKVQLGNKLFHDSLLSHNGAIACASCHDLMKGGTDRKVHSIGINGADRQH